MVEAGSQQPLADVAVGVQGGRRGGASVVTDSTGRFALEGLDPTAYHLTARKPAYTTDTRDVTAAEDMDLRIELRRGDGIVIVAHDGIYGMALRSLMARVADTQGTTVFAGGVTLDGNGQGEIPSLPAGAYQMRLGAPGYAPLALPAVTRPRPSDSRLPDAGRGARPRDRSHHPGPARRLRRARRRRRHLLPVVVLARRPHPPHEPGAAARRTSHPATTASWSRAASAGRST